MSIRAASLSLAFVALTASLSAQQPKVFAPHEPIPPKAAKQVKWLTPAMQRSMVGGLWMTDADFKSSMLVSSKIGVPFSPRRSGGRDGAVLSPPHIAFIRMQVVMCSPSVVLAI
jgi:hypothetical protein